MMKESWKISKWIIIIKSHAIEEWIEKDLFSLLTKHEHIGKLSNFSITSNFLRKLEKIFVMKIHSIIVDQTSDFWSKVYPNEVDKPYFTLLQSLYAWRNLLLEIGFHWSYKWLQSFFKILKWRNSVLKNWKVQRQWFGLRDFLMPSLEYIQPELFQTLSSESYKVLPSLFNNYIHTTDTVREYSNILPYFYH